MDISSMSPEMIPMLSTVMAQNKVQENASALMLAKTMDVQEQGGQALVDMMRSSMERSITPNLGGNIDISL
ncbi:MAG: YjfB family protein [Lachnospiraceae bacterium]|nr:YjfB family protein [Lachnospiraceae bacterium]